MHSAFFSLLVFSVAVLIAVPWYLIGRARRWSALYRWASNAGYRILEARQPWLTEAGPFPFTWSKAQQVFNVRVKDADGVEKHGWVLLGSAWRGLAKDEVRELWE
jgi:hypothetical protein